MPKVNVKWTSLERKPKEATSEVSKEATSSESEQVSPEVPKQATPEVPSETEQPAVRQPIKIDLQPKNVEPKPEQKQPITAQSYIHQRMQQLRQKAQTVQPTPVQTKPQKVKRERKFDFSSKWHIGEALNNPIVLAAGIGGAFVIAQKFL
jgi:hypothetical protein